MKKLHSTWVSDSKPATTAGEPAQGEETMEKEKSSDHLPPWAHYFNIDPAKLGSEVLMAMLPEMADYLPRGIGALLEKFNNLRLPLPEGVRESLVKPLQHAIELLGVKSAATTTAPTAPVAAADEPKVTPVTPAAEPPKATPAPVAPAAAPAAPPKKAPTTPPPVPAAATAPAVKAVAPAPAATGVPTHTSARARLAASKAVTAAHVAPPKAAAAPAPTTRVATLVPKEEPKAVRRVVALAPAPKVAPRLCQYRINRDDHEGCNNEAKPDTVACTEHSSPCPTCHRNLVPVWMANRAMFDRKTNKKIIIDGNQIGSHCHDCAAQIFKNYQNPDWNWVINQPKPEQIQADTEYDVDFYEKLRAAEPATDPEPVDAVDGDAVATDDSVLDDGDVTVIDDGDAVELVYCEFKGGIPLESGRDKNGTFQFDSTGKCLNTGATPNAKRNKNFCARHQNGKVRGSDMEAANKAKK